MEHDKLYGARETGGLTDGRAYHDQFAGARTVDWTAPGLRVTRLRLVSDPGFPLWRPFVGFVMTNSFVG